MSTSTRDDARDQARRTIDDHIQVLCDAVEHERASASFKAYLNAQALFHDYSWHNTLLIVSQCPTARRVAGYRTWQKLGRQVRKGEKSIRIFAPCTFKRENAETGQTESGMYFRMVSVFDVGQTDGEALPDIDIPDIDEHADGVLSHLMGVADVSHIPVEYQADYDAEGRSFKGRIVLNDRGTSGQRAATLAHELAHEALHYRDRGKLTRSIAELEAEAIAYVVLTHFGIETTIQSARYIAMYSGESKAIRDSLKRIADTARAIIDGKPIGKNVDPEFIKKAQAAA